MENSKITSGEFKGREILSPKNPKTHPMGARARLGLFNALGSLMRMDGAGVLDLYAGSGALGFEALSRGAERVVFVEKDRNTAETIRKTAESLGVLDRVEIIRKSVQHTNLRRRHFDLILVDPPYDRFDVSEWRVLCGADVSDSILAVSHPPMPAEGPSRFIVSNKKYGGCEIAIFKYPDHDEMMRIQREMFAEMGIDEDWLRARGLI